MLELPARLIGRFVTKQYDSVAKRKLAIYLNTPNFDETTPTPRRKGIRTRIRLTNDKMKDLTSRDSIPLHRIIVLEPFVDVNNRNQDAILLCVFHTPSDNRIEIIAYVMDNSASLLKYTDYYTILKDRDSARCSSNSDSLRSNKNERSRKRSVKIVSDGNNTSDSTSTKHSVNNRIVSNNWVLLKDERTLSAQGTNPTTPAPRKATTSSPKIAPKPAFVFNNNQKKSSIQFDRKNYQTSQIFKENNESNQNYPLNGNILDIKPIVVTPPSTKSLRPQTKSNTIPSLTASISSSKRTLTGSEDYNREIEEALKGLNAILSNARMVNSSSEQLSLSSHTDDVTRSCVASARIGKYTNRRSHSMINDNAMISTSSDSDAPIMNSHKKSYLRNTSGLTGSEVVDIINGGITTTISQEPSIYYDCNKDSIKGNSLPVVNNNNEHFMSSVSKPISSPKTPEVDLYRDSLRTVVEHLSSDIQQLKEIVVNNQNNYQTSSKPQNILLSKKLQSSLSSLQRLAIQESLSNLRGTVKACVTSPQPILINNKNKRYSFDNNTLSPTITHLGPPSTISRGNSSRFSYNVAVNDIANNANNANNLTLSDIANNELHHYPVTLSMTQKHRRKLADNRMKIPDYLLPFQLPPPSVPPTTPEYAQHNGILNNNYKDSRMGNKHYRSNKNYGRPLSNEAPCTGCSRRILGLNMRTRSKSCERY